MGFWERIKANGSGSGEDARIEFGTRGEDITYRRCGRQVEIGYTYIGGDRLYTETIDGWSDGERLSDAEKETLFNDVLRYLSGPLRRTIIVINVDDPSHELWERLARHNQELIKAVETDSNSQQRESERQMYLETLTRQKRLLIDDVEITSEKELDEFLEEFPSRK